MMSEYKIGKVLKDLEKAYNWKLKANLNRVCTNIYNTFWMTLPYNGNYTAEWMCKLLLDKYNKKEIVLWPWWSLERWTNNLLNNEIWSYWSLIAWNATINTSEWKSLVSLGLWTYLKDCLLVDTWLEDGVIIEWGMFTKISKSYINTGTVFFGGAKVRESTIGERNEIGQAEIVRTTTWKLIKALHRSFLGDAELWDNINVSNFFGIMNSSHEGVKSKVKIWNNVFLWWRSAVISGDKWITIGDNAVIAGWAVVLCDVPSGHTYINKDNIYPTGSRKQK